MKAKIFIFIFILGSLLVASPVLCANSGNYGLYTTADKAGLVRGQNISETIGAVIGTGLSIIGVLFFILMLYGGFLWMTAHGNEDQSGKALSTIIAAAIGLIIIMASYAITNFVFKSVVTDVATPPAGTTPRL